MNNILQKIAGIFGINQNIKSPVSDPNNMMKSPYNFPTDKQGQDSLANYYATEGSPTGSSYGPSQQARQQSPAPQPTTYQRQAPSANAMPTSSQQSNSPAVQNNHQAFISLMASHVLPITRQFGIPDAVAISQAAQESGYGTSPLAENYNNLFGLKAHSYPGFAHFNTPEDSAKYYAQTVQALSGGDMGKYKNDSMGLLKALQGHGKTGNYEGDNSNPMQYVYDVSNNPLWQQYGGGKPMQQNPMGWN